MILNIGGGGGLPIRLIVTAPTGSAVSVTQGTTVLAANEVDGVWTFAIPSLGVWTIHATIEGQSLTQDVDISKVGQYNVTLEAPIKATLNDNDWATIRDIADESKGANYWAVGDTKQITINGKLSDGLTLNNYSTWVYIIGFDHNKDVEGTGIAFGGFKTAQANGTDICLCDSGYDTVITSGQWFSMNNNSSTSGGWNSCNMRNNTLPVVKAALPSDLQAVLKTTTLYTDNTGGSSTSASYVTATQDELYLLAEFEIFGARTHANTAEQNYQTQYAYYAAGNSKVKHKHNSTATVAAWWERSVSAAYEHDFCDVKTTGIAGGTISHYSEGLAVAFKVGGAKYKPVEYISSNGAQYINTGYVPTPNTRVVIDAEVTSQTTASCSYFGERSGAGPTDKTAYEIWSMGTAANVSSDFFGNRVSYTISTKQRLLIDKNKATVTINGNTVTNSAAAGTATIPAYLFASNDNNTAAFFINMKLYSCKIYENDALVRDYIPAKDELGNAGLYDKVEGKLYYNAGTGSFKIPGVRTIDSASVGQSVYCNVNDLKKEFIIVHQGKPSSMYDDSCDGTWLLMKDIYEERQWNSSSDNIYGASTIHSYLNSTFLNRLDIKDVIKQVKIPYVNGWGGSAVASGANGLSAKVFLLSGYEVGLGGAEFVPQDGAKLSYFNQNAGKDAKRIAYLYGSTTAGVWWLRSAYTDSNSVALVIVTTGSYSYPFVNDTKGVRPAFIVPSDTYIDEDNNILTASPYNAISTLNVGNSVFCEENGTDTEFILVHKGLPGAMYDGSNYDASCNGAWLLRKTLMNTMAWSANETNRWGDSIIADWLNSTYINYLNISSIVKTVKIPYAAGMGMTTMFEATCKVFLLSGRELGWNDPSLGVEGSKLNYFTAGSDGNNKRIAHFQGDINSWWTRSPNANARVAAAFVKTSGGLDINLNVESMLCVRPAFIVSLDTLVDSNNNIVV